MSSQHVTELEQLIKAQQERMMAYDLAAASTDDETLKNYFTAKAEEAEAEMETLNQLSPAADWDMANNKPVLPCSALFQRGLHHYSATFLINCVKQMEKNVNRLYKRVISELKGGPASLLQQLKMQHKQLLTGQQMMASL